MKRNASAGSTTVAILLILSILILTFVTLYLFMARTWWFPKSITVLGDEIDAQFVRTMIICGVVFTVSQLALAWAILRYRDTGGRATYSHGNNTMEVLWTVATAIMFIGLGIYARSSWAEMHFRGAQPGAVQIHVMAQQFAWNFHYPGADGQFGKSIFKKVNNSGTDPFSLDESDPAYADDVVTAVIGVPVNEEIELTLLAKDVIHSFFVRELRIKQDLVPGMKIPIHFTANEVGDYELACFELCGLGHQRMRSFLKVMPRPDYEKWLAGQKAEE